MAVQTRSERGEGIDRVLTNLSSLRGVTTAALVDGDGLVTHIRRDFEVDVDALGAASQIMFTSGRRAAANMGQDEVKIIISENKNGIILMSPLNKAFILVLVTDTSGMLGTIRFEMRESIADLNNLLGR